MVVLFLTVMIAMILLRALRKDIAQYNDASYLEGTYLCVCDKMLQISSLMLLDSYWLFWLTYRYLHLLFGLNSLPLSHSAPLLHPPPHSLCPPLPILISPTPLPSPLLSSHTSPRYSPSHPIISSLFFSPTPHFILPLLPYLSHFFFSSPYLDAKEESGWKLVHGDVFRPPTTMPMLFRWFIYVCNLIFVASHCDIFISLSECW